MKYGFRGVSGAALLLGLAGSIQGAFAQAPATPQNQTVTTSGPQAQTPASQTAPVEVNQQDQAATQNNRVVVTGSLIAGLPEDAPRPVEVYTKQDLEDIGSPSAAEFIRDLSLAFDSDIGGLESS